MSTRRIFYVGALAAVVAAGGCQALEHNPPLPGGAGNVGGSSGEGNGGQNPDPDGGASARISGQLCLIIDTRNPTSCDFVDMSRYRVTDTATGATASTDIDGRFELVVDDAAQINLAVETDTADIDIVPALVPVPLQDQVLVPVVAVQDFDLLIELLGASDLGVDTSTLLVYVFDGVMPLQNVDLRDPVGNAGVFYDDDSEFSGWAFGGVTGPLGAILALGLDPNNDSVLLGLEGFEQTLTNIPFEPGAMTLVEADFVFELGAAPLLRAE